MFRHGRVYEDEVEKQKRFKIFKQNVVFIDSFNNAKNLAYKLSVNEFADEEFKASRNGYKMKYKVKSSQIV